MLPLHFFGLGSGKDKVVGVFWNRRTDKFTIWDTGRSQEGFYDQLEKDIIPKLNKSDYAASLMSKNRMIEHPLSPILFPLSRLTIGGCLLTVVSA